MLQRQITASRLLLELLGREEEDFLAVQIISNLANSSNNSQLDRYSGELNSSNRLVRRQQEEAYLAIWGAIMRNNLLLAQRRPEQEVACSVEEVYSGTSRRRHLLLVRPVQAVRVFSAVEDHLCLADNNSSSSRNNLNKARRRCSVRQTNNSNSQVNPLHCLAHNNNRNNSNSKVVSLPGSRHPPSQTSSAGSSNSNSNLRARV